MSWIYFLGHLSPYALPGSNAHRRNFCHFDEDCWNFQAVIGDDIVRPLSAIIEFRGWRTLKGNLALLPVTVCKIHCVNKSKLPVN
jgi:hypothetical protein